MHIFSKINTLFIHIPKTGGTSLVAHFQRRGKEVINLSNRYAPPYHQTYLSIKNHLPNVDDYKIITVIRNPFNRLVSDLLFLKNHFLKNHPYLHQYFLSVDELYKPEILEKKVFWYLNDCKNEDIDNHKLEQYKFIINENQELVKNILIFRTETLEKDLKEASIIDENDTLEKENVSAGLEDYTTFLTDNAKNAIMEYYKIDFYLWEHKKLPKA